MAKIAEAFVEIRARTSALQTGVRRAVASVRAGVQRMRASLSGLQAAFAAIGLGIGVRAAIKAFTEEEDAIAKLRAALASTSQEVEGNTDAIIKQAGAIQRVTRIGDEMTIKLAAMAVGFGDTADAATNTVKAAAGLAAKLGQDLSPEMLRYVVLAKQGEFTMLQRYIPALRAAGSAQEKFAILQQFVNEGWQEQIALGKTTAGGIAQLKNAFGDLLEQLGRMFIVSGVFDGIKASVQDLTDLLSRINDHIDVWKSGLGDVRRFWDEIRISAVGTASVMRDLFDIFTNPFSSTTMDDILQRMQDVMDLEVQFQRMRGAGPGGPDLGAFAGQSASGAAKRATDSIQTAVGSLKIRSRQDELMRQSVDTQKKTEQHVRDMARDVDDIRNELRGGVEVSA